MAGGTYTTFLVVSRRVFPDGGWLMTTPPDAASMRQRGFHIEQIQARFALLVVLLGMLRVRVTSS
jgi:hypothetical protein